ncbi:uncharacterized protein LOC143188644 isoform X2 [Calliopsis andreniformis]|uniref:uncharacterized protein LOC143188644 isoform X2 n=1 Tax=Calliopsis andreniformis TaxID=337506 RepID=UPI003FCC7ADF
MFHSLINISTKPLACRSRQIVTNVALQVRKTDSDVKEESTRMKQFHKKLKLQPIPKVGPKERFVDLMLVETDPSSGELIPDSEKDPTKWGDWQHGGRQKE